MKLYGITYDKGKRAPHTVYVSQYSAYKLGIAGGTTVKLYQGDTEITAESDKWHGYTVYSMTAGAASRTEYRVVIDGVTMRLTVVATDSTVAELPQSSGGGGGEYVLPTATATRLGGVKIGDNVTVAADGTVSVAAPYTLPVASESAIGGVKSGGGITVDGTGIATLNLPYASSENLGAIKVGSGLETDGTGLLSAQRQVYDVTAQSASAVTVSDGSVNDCASTVSTITVPATVRDTIVCVAAASTTWDVTAWTTIVSDDADVWTYTAPAIYTMTRIGDGKLLVQRKNLSTVTA